MSFRPISFQESRTTLDGLSGGLTGRVFFHRILRVRGNGQMAAARIAAATNEAFIIVISSTGE